MKLEAAKDLRNGLYAGVRTYEPNTPLDIVDAYREMLEETIGVFYEGCFLNRYNTQKDWLGWHSDDDKGIDHSHPICVISLGQEREINWKKIGEKGYDCINSQMLGEGSLFVMPAGMQQTHYHRIPKMSFPSPRPRISLTFRALL